MCIYLFCSNLSSESVKAGDPNLVKLHQTAVFTPICFRYKRNNIQALFCCIRKQGILSIILYSPVNIHFCTDSCLIRISYSLVYAQLSYTALVLYMVVLYTASTVFGCTVIHRHWLSGASSHYGKQLEDRWYPV